VVHRAVDDQLAAQSFGETSPWAYTGFLFVKVYHTGLLGWLALAGWVLALRRPAEPGTRFVLIWGIGLLLIFSLFPVSLSPPEFIRKTATYMEIFVTPLALRATTLFPLSKRMCLGTEAPKVRENRGSLLN
jgi:hypothetical protein